MTPGFAFGREPGGVGRRWRRPPASSSRGWACLNLNQGPAVIADTTGDIEPAVEARSGLPRAQLQLGDPAAALASAATHRERSYPIEDPAIQLLEGMALLGLNRTDEAAQAFTGALTAADALLALADSNVAGVAADTQRLLEMIAAHDQSAVLTELSAAQDPVIDDGWDARQRAIQLLSIIHRAMPSVNNSIHILTGVYAALRVSELRRYSHFGGAFCARSPGRVPPLLTRSSSCIHVKVARAPGPAWDGRGAARGLGGLGFMLRRVAMRSQCAG
jgi:hypothetical protein